LTALDVASGESSFEVRAARPTAAEPTTWGNIKAHFETGD
jgi:hypothetical protein